MNIVDIIEKSAKHVYEKLGKGHSECVYHKALLHALMLANLKYETEVIVPIYYETHNCGHFRCDVIVEKEIILELKAVNKISFLEEDSEIIQLKNYLKCTGLKIGLLINFSKSGPCVVIKQIHK